MSTPATPGTLSRASRTVATQPIQGTLPSTNSTSVTLAGGAYAQLASAVPCQQSWHGTATHHDFLILAPSSPPFFRQSTIVSALVFLLSKWTVKSLSPTLMSMLPTPSTSFNALRTAVTQAPQMSLPSSNLAEVLVVASLVASLVVGVLPPSSPDLGSALQPARSRAQTPTVINRIMVSLGEWGTPRDIREGRTYYARVTDRLTKVAWPRADRRKSRRSAKPARWSAAPGSEDVLGRRGRGRPTSQPPKPAQLVPT